MSNKPYPFSKSDAEWREQLDDLQYQVTRHAATERAFTGQYWDHWARGHYDCVCCGTRLFEAETKFDAGCGWPSYWAPIDADVIEDLDHLAREPALRKLRRALHEQHDVVGLHFVLDELLDAHFAS